MRILHRPLAAAVAALLASVPILVAVGSPAQAAPVPTDYSGSASAVQQVITATVLGVNRADLAVAPSTAEFDSAQVPRSIATAENAGAGDTVLSVPVVADGLQVSAGPAAEDNADAAALVGFDAAPVLFVDDIDATVHAAWAGDAACVDIGTPISEATTNTASTTVLAVLPGGGAAITTGDVSTATTTGLVAGAGGPTDARAVQSVATAHMDGLSLLGDTVTVAVEGDPTIVATADGTAGGAVAEYANVPLVTVTDPVNGDTVLTPGDTVTRSVPLGTATITMGDLSINNEAANGTNASADLVFLTVAVTLADGLGSTTAEFLPMAVDATAPVGGVECALPAPVVITPANGSTTNDSTPTISGTGVAGSTVTVTLDGVPDGSTVVLANGTWRLTSPALADGTHTVRARQTLNGLTSGVSNTNRFIVDTTVAVAITAPVNGSTISDPTPTVTGTSDILNGTITVSVDGGTPITVATDANGNWALTLATALRNGAHIITATAVDAAGNTLTDTTRFTVAAPASPVLAFTGFESGGLLALAILFLVMGAGAVRLRSIRR